MPGRKRRDRRRSRNSRNSWRNSRRSWKRSKNWGRIEGILTSADRGKAKKIHITIRAESNSHITVRRKDGSNLRKSHRLSLRVVNLFTGRRRWSIWTALTLPIPTSTGAKFDFYYCRGHLNLYSINHITHGHIMHILTKHHIKPI